MKNTINIRLICNTWLLGVILLLTGSPASAEDNAANPGPSERDTIYPERAFDAALAKKSLERGSSTISGKACTIVEGGRIFYAQNAPVVMFPATPYIEEWYELRRKHKDRKVKISDEANNLAFEVKTDGDGNFTFEKIKPGKYLIGMDHNFTQVKTKRVFTGEVVATPGASADGGTNYSNAFYEEEYGVDQSSTLERFVVIKKDGEFKKVTLSNRRIGTCAFGFGTQN